LIKVLKNFKEKKLQNFKDKNMETFIAIPAVIILLAGILWLAKKILKPVKGHLPDCCGPRGNRDI
jgi:hypothetical protein